MLLVLHFKYSELSKVFKSGWVFMERHHELAINLKSFPFQERDRIVVFLTENQGKKQASPREATIPRDMGAHSTFLSALRWIT